ncbi:MAG: tetratricopeptide repeat protein [Pseudomonadota bacterium]
MEKIPARAAQLWFAAGRMLETRLDDPSGAVDAYKSVLRLEPGNVEAMKALAGAGAAAGEWRSAAKAFVSLSKQRGALNGAILEELTGRAAKTSAWDQLTEALAAVIIERAEDLPAGLLSELEYTIALWHKEHRGDLDAAELAARRAVKQRESDLATLRLLAEIQRRSPGPPLVKTLLCIDGLSHRDLDAICEAAETALQQKEEPDLAREVLQLLYRRGAGLLSYAQKAVGQRTAGDSVTWALDRLVEIYRREDNAKQAAALMIDGARLPFDASRSLELRKRAAAIFEEERQHGRALELCQDILRETPDDLETLRRAAALCERENRFGELLSLRQHELTLVQEPGKKIELRLEISRLAGRFEGRSVRIDPLLANLEQRPGHEASINSVVEVYSNRGLYADLVDILSDQAAKLEKQDDPERAAALWGRIAALVEKNLHDEEKAIAAYRKVVDLACTNEALDGLARLYIERKEPLEAAKWLEQRLEGAGGDERSSTILKLARSLLMAEQHDRAVTWLEALFAESPRNSEVRRLLFDLYRKRETWRPLAAALTTAAEHVDDRDAIVTYAREAWEIYNDRLETPGEAIKVLERARSVDQGDRGLKQHMAVAYYSAQKLDESRALVEELIEGFGRRRSPERANLHLLLARILHAQENAERALDELETAVKMDSNNATILKTMAELARGSGNLERAEFAYRTLLLTVRRRKEDRTDTEQIQPSEVLVELSRIAADRGQKEQATELIESTIEAIMHNDSEAPGLEANLRDHKEYELLRRVLETRLTQITNPRIRAKIQSDLADLLETEFGQPDDALELRLGAIESDAVLPGYHKAARDLASRLKKLDGYVSKVEKMLEKTRRPADVHARCELLLQLGEVMERDFENPEKAAGLYAMAEKTGVREVDVWRAAARVAKSLGNDQEQVRLLGLLTGLGEGREETRMSALYSLAEVQLSHEDTLEEGLKTLATVMDEDPRYERAGLIVRRASEIHPGSNDILDLYEKIVRKSGDEKMTLHYLEGRIAQPDASLEHAREAVDIALKLEEWERAEKLMLRAVDIGCYMTAGMKTAGWALLGLAERRMEAGDLAGAVKWLGEAGVSDEQDRLFELCGRLAQIASGEEGDKALVTRLYESLLQHYPTAREIWEPLADIYVEMKDAAGLDRLTEGVVDSLEDAAERNTLRLRQARLLLGAGERMDDAVEVLRAVLVEDPHHEEARPLLLEYLERSGKEEELIDHLRDSLLAAQSRKDIEAITSLSLRLGKMIGKDNPEEAVSIYRSSLFWAPEDRGLLESLLEMLGPDHDLQERAELMMRLLSSTKGEQAAKLALELAGMYVSAGDNAGMMSALELGCRRAPDSNEVLDRMEKAYRDVGDYRGLASILMEAADRKENDQDKVGLLLKAAALQREQLANPSGALEVLKMASDLAPEDLSIALQQAACMKDTGEQRQAIDKISSILESRPDDESLVRDLLGMRAELLSAVGDAKAAVEDLEKLFKQDKAAGPQLEEAMIKVYENALESGDNETARKYMMRLVDFYASEGKHDQARAQLDRWIDKNFEDLEILYRLRDIDAKENNWEGVVKYSSKLVELEEGEDEVHSIQRMSNAYIQLERPGDARSVLEKARKKHPGNAPLRQELLQLYEKEGVKKELARLLMEEAEVAGQDKQVELLRRAAVLLKESDDPDEAGPILKKLLEKEPEDLATIRELADLYVDAGQLDDADALLDRAIDAFKGQRSPELSLLYHLKSAVSGILGEEETQLNFLNEAFKMDRKNGRISAELADLAEEQENWKVAVTALSNCSTMREDCPISAYEAFLRLARVHVRLEDPQRALFLARRALRENPESEEAAALVRKLSSEQ